MSNDSRFSRRAVLHAPAVAAGMILVDRAPGTDPDAEPGDNDKRRHQAMPPAVQDVQRGLYAASITEYGTAFDRGGYVDCAVVFTAAPSGRAIIHWSGAPRNLHDAGIAVAYLSVEVRTGDVIGSGDVVLLGGDERSVRTNLTGTVQSVRAGASHLLSGLTPNAAYNARMVHRVTSQIGEFFQRGLIVAPTS